MADNNKRGDPLTRGLGVAIALGALAVGAAAAFLNSERNREMREDLQRQITDLSGRMDQELSARRPEIEDAIQRGRQAAVESLDRVKTAVEQGADFAQEYVRKASVKTSDAAVDLRGQTPAIEGDGADKVQDTVNSVTTSPEGTLADVGSAAQDNLAGTDYSGASSSQSGDGTTTNLGNQASGNVSDDNPHTEQADADDLADPAREQVAESGNAFGDTVGSAGGTIGSATVESAQALDDAAYDQQQGISGGEGLTEESPGMADYGGNTGLNADTGVDTPSRGDGNSQ